MKKTRKNKEEHHGLINLCSEISEGLSDKKNRTLIEECWYQGLKKALEGIY